MATISTTTEKLNSIMYSFIDVIWQNIYEDKSTMPRTLKDDLIHNSRIRNQIYDWANTEREGAWVMADYASPQNDGFYKARDETGKEGQFHYIYGKWHTLDGKKIIKWFDTKLNQKPCPSCKCKDHEKDELQKQLDAVMQENKELKRDIQFKLNHIIIRDEVLIALEKANTEIERLQSLTKQKEKSHHGRQTVYEG